ncbi:MAG: hypothetical protein II187_01165 [Treponema sp.]|nr:hypothetical protein [Treponema sp.]
MLPVLSAEYDFTSFLEIRQLPCPAPGRKNLEALSLIIGWNSQFCKASGSFFILFLYFYVQDAGGAGHFSAGSTFFGMLPAAFQCAGFFAKKAVY